MSRPLNKYQRKQYQRKKALKLYKSGINNNYCGTSVAFTPKENNDCTLYEIDNHTAKDYSIIIKYPNNTNSKRFYKRVSNKKIRTHIHRLKNGDYKKVFDYWWTLY